MPYLRYLCLFAHSGVKHILRCVFVLFVFVIHYEVFISKISGGIRNSHFHIGSISALAKTMNFSMD